MRWNISNALSFAIIALFILWPPYILRKIKGNRDRMLHTEENLVYDEVDEAEYRRIVRSRQEDDFIVDDGTADYNEYADHGGELWDDADFAGESGTAQRGVPILGKRVDRMGRRDDR